MTHMFWTPRRIGATLGFATVIAAAGLGCSSTPVDPARERSPGATTSTTVPRDNTVPPDSGVPTEDVSPVDPSVGPPAQPDAGVGGSDLEPTSIP